MMKKFLLNLAVAAMVCLMLLQLVPMKSRAATEHSVAISKATDYTLTLTAFNYEPHVLYEKDRYTIEDVTSIVASVSRTEGKNLIVQCRVFYYSPLVGSTNMAFEVTVPTAYCTLEIQEESLSWISPVSKEYLSANFRVTRPAKAHVGGNPDCYTFATCTVCGVTYLGTCQYQWKQENGKHWQQCPRDEGHKGIEGTCSGGTATCSSPAICDVCKLPYGSVNAANHNTALTYTNGFCPSGCYEPAKLVDGVYQIANAGNLFWFAQQINNGSMGQFYAKLTGDITFGTEQDGKWVAMNTPESVSMGSVLDGAGHVLRIGQQNDGLFSSFNYGTVKDLTLEGSIHANVGQVGAIAASAYRTRLQQVSSYVDVRNDGGDAGGLVGYYGGKHDGDVKSLITDCAVYADITGIDAGGFIGEGWNGTQYFDITNCVYVGNVEGTNAGAIVGYQNTDTNTCRFTNVYWNEADGLDFYGKRDTANQVYTNTEAMSLTAFAGGEVAYKLGAAWGQRIGTDPYPLLGGAAVYAYTDCLGAKHYANTAEAGGHTFDEKEQCTTCGAWNAQLQVERVTLRPECAGLYFGGSFRLPEAMPVVRRGIAVSIHSQAPVADGTDPNSRCSEGTTSLLVSNILRARLKDSSNENRANMLIFARAYVELADGSYLYSEVFSTSLRQVAQAADAQWATLDSAQKTAFTAMYQKFLPVMENWNLPNSKEN